MKTNLILGNPLLGVLGALMWTSTLLKADSKHADSSYGVCEVYTGSMCAEFLKGKKVHVKRYTNQNILDTRIASWLQTGKRTRSISGTCWPHAKVLICYHTFPVCKGDSYSQHPFCQDECNYLETRVCRKEFALAKSISLIRHYVPSCRNLPKPGTPQYANCQRLPSLRKIKLAPGLSVAYRKNSTVSQMQRASMKCYFNVFNLGKMAQQPIKMKWYDVGNSVLRRGGKYRIKRRKRGEFRIISTLIIKSATLNDAGYYHCEAKQGKKRVKSGVYLKVINDSQHKHKGRDKGGRKSHRPKSTLRKTQDKTIFSNGFGRCVPYRGTVCAKYLTKGNNNHVFEYSYSPQSLVERRLIREFRRINQTGVFSKKCEEMGLAIMCHHVFNACNHSSSSPVSRLCQDDCNLFDKVFCKNEVEMARKHSSAFEFLPDCSLLPEDNNLCQPVSDIQAKKRRDQNDTDCYKNMGKDYNGFTNVSRTGQHCKPWKQFSPVYKFSHNYCRNFGGENFAPWCYVGRGTKEFCSIQKCPGQGNTSRIMDDVPDTGCYTGNGESYLGLVKTSETDRVCLRWSEVGSYTARHNYCRNYGGKKKAPWCFVAKDVQEYCKIPECGLSASSISEDESPPLVYYLVPLAIALSVLLLVILVLLVYLKKRKKGNIDSQIHQQTKEVSHPVGEKVASEDEITDLRLQKTLTRDVAEAGEIAVL